MLRKLDELHDFAIHGSDGIIGHIKDFYFDDHAWVIRYFVVETGGWLSSRKVLISPIGTGRPDRQAKTLPASITMDQVRNSPDIDTDKPVSRQHEGEFLEHYAYPLYWVGPGLWGAGNYPSPYLMVMPEFVSTPAVITPVIDEVQPLADAARVNGTATHHLDPDLRSCKVVTGYRIHATDGEIGHVHGFLFDEGTWQIRHLIVNTSNWWLGHQVLIEPESIESVSWFDGMVSIKLTREQVQNAQRYDPATLLDQVP
ncbi:MAG: PRC-barrel domain-containing protein [Lysobacteraceae bacterium]